METSSGTRCAFTVNFASVSQALFGLLGVVVGGVISTLWAWLSVIRQELSDAMVAARLVDEDLKVVEDWDDREGPGRVDRALWEAHRVPLAKVLGEHQWRSVADVYRVNIPVVGDKPKVAEARAALRPLVRVSAA
jgi:hypothetical protein